LRDPEPDWPALIAACYAHPHSDGPLGRFFEALTPYLRAALAVRSISDPTLVDDALQATFLKSLKLFAQTPSPPVGVGYFVVMAKHCLIDELRRRRGHLRIDEIAESDLPQTPGKGPEPDDRLLLIQYGLARMEPRCRFVLERYYIDEVDSRALAKQLQVGPDSVHVVIKRCRDRLRLELQKLTENSR
jgi:RNA polymerase sigma factor (sigma-70 family)